VGKKSDGVSECEAARTHEQPTRSESDMLDTALVVVFQWNAGKQRRMWTSVQAVAERGSVVRSKHAMPSCCGEGRRDVL
jgi:hypothetical protein